MAWFKKQQYALLNVSRERDRIPDGLCSKCSKCGAILLTREFEENLKVCPKCGYHDKLSPRERIEQTVDAGTFVETCADMVSADPLGFVDSKAYPDRIAQSQERSKSKDAVLTGHGSIHGMTVSLAFMDFGFVGGSMGSVVGEKIARVLEYAIEQKIPAVVFCTSGGARMQEGILSLMQMAKTSALVARMHEARLPYITVLVDPTTAGVMASFASLGDLVIAEPAALVGFAGPRVIEQTIRQVLPKGFQRSEFVQEHGFIDMIVPRQKMKSTLANVLSLLTHREAVADESDDLASDT